LESQTRALQTEYLRGTIIPERRGYRFITVKSKSKGHGYFVVYEVLSTEVLIFNYFHTAQDWRRRLRSMLPEP
jgi:plasmid stabilization system protein ParE